VSVLDIINNIMQEEPEYTIPYTLKERLIMASKIALFGLIFVPIYHYYLFPIQKHYLDTMHCRVNIIFEIKIISLIFLLFFILFPVLGIFLGRKIIINKRFPLKSKSDFKRKIHRGKSAVLLYPPLSRPIFTFF